MPVGLRTGRGHQIRGASFRSLSLARQKPVCHLEHRSGPDSHVDRLPPVVDVPALVLGLAGPALDQLVGDLQRFRT